MKQQDVARVAIYARYSSDNQRDESIDAQIRAIEVYANQHNYSIVKIYVDRAKSATTDKRPEFQKMIEDSALKLFDGVIVHKLDRFSRDKYDSAMYKRKLKKNKVQLISITENLDGSPESIILESVLEGMAEYYSKNLAREVMKGMSETAYQCKHTGGSPPLGYDVDPVTKKLIINEKEAVIIKEIFDLYINNYGYNKIIKIFKEKNYKTKAGKYFGKNSLNNILSNEKYCGYYIFNKSASRDIFGTRNTHATKDDAHIIRIEGGVPVIVPEEIFRQVKVKMADNKRRCGQYRAKQVYLLSGLIFCGECGHAMHGNFRHGRFNKKYITYRCGKKDRSQQCDNKELRREYVEAFVLSELEKKLFNDDVIPHLVENLNEYQDIKNNENVNLIVEYKAELADITKKIDNIIEAIANGFFQASFKEKVAELEDRKIQIEISLKEFDLKKSNDKISESGLRGMLGMFKAFVVERDIPECKKFIDSYVERVLIYNDRVEVTFKVALAFMKTNNSYNFTSSIKIKNLFRNFPIPEECASGF